MTKGAYTLSDIDWRVVRLYCPQCHQFAQFRRSALLKRFGPDKVMPSMLRDLKPCDIGGSTSGPQCQLGYWDAMTDQARAEAIGGRTAGELGLIGFAGLFRQSRC